MNVEGNIIWVTPSTTTIPLPPRVPVACPGCGRCFVCGRGNEPIFPYPHITWGTDTKLPEVTW